MDGETTYNAGIVGTIDLLHRQPSSDSNMTDRVQLLPCSIKHDGPISSLEALDIVVDGFSVKEAFFRGRNFLGATVPIPEGYTGVFGYVLDKKKPMKGKRAYGSEEEEEGFSQLESRAEFRNITYWNHDTPPSANDPLLRGFQWVSVADALHNPITAEELASTSTILEEKTQAT